MTVSIDGVTVVDGDFHVDAQHNWVSFPLTLSRGAHEVTAESDSGATLRESFQVPRRQSALRGHRPLGRGRPSAELTWLFQRQPMAFG